MCIALAVCRNSSAAREAHAAVTPPTTRGVDSGAWASTPGSMRSGLNATNTSRPTSRSPVLQRLYDQFARAPDIRGGGQHDRLSGGGVGDHVGAGARQRSQVRRLVSVDGGGTHTTIASARDNAVGSVVSATSRPPGGGPGAGGLGSAGQPAGLDIGQAGFADIAADDARTVIGQGQRRRQSHIPQPHHRNASSLSVLPAPAPATFATTSATCSAVGAASSL